MKLRFFPYELKLKDAFTLSYGSRTNTPVILLEIENNGIIGYGEASLPPYLLENQKSVIKFLSKIKLDSFSDVQELDSILDYIINFMTGNFAAKAALDIALHDLTCKTLNISLPEFLNIHSDKIVYTSFTIGISELDKIEQKIKSSSEFKILKVKLGTNNDREIINTIRSFTDKPLFIDVNQGWHDKYFAIEMINWLKEQNVILIEQPLPKERLDDAIWLNEKSPLPIIADEGVQISNDLQTIKDAYSGVNIKLMKTGGIREAYRMIKKAKKLNLKIMLGCMTETSCAITAASHLSPLADWVDLDGAALISNDIFSGMKIVSGTIRIPKEPGIGVRKLP